MLLHLDAIGHRRFHRLGVQLGLAQASTCLLAIGCPRSMPRSLRVSLGRFTNAEDVEYFLERAAIVERLRSMNPLYERIKVAEAAR